MGEHARPPFLLSLFLLAIVHKDAKRGPIELNIHKPNVHALAYWMLRAARLGMAIERRSGRDVALDVYTTLMPAGVTETRSNVTVRIHAALPDELAQTQAHAPSTFSRTLVVTLQKWAAVSLVDAEYVCALDLDMDVFLPTLEPFADAVADEWLDAFARMRGVGAHLASYPDHSSPINAGFMLLRPNRSLYEEGVRLLARADRAWSVDAGWDLLGRPLDVVPRTDVVMLDDGRDHAKALWVSEGKWNFHGAMLDQVRALRRAAPPRLPLHAPRARSRSEPLARPSSRTRRSASPRPACMAPGSPSGFFLPHVPGAKELAVRHRRALPATRDGERGRGACLGERARGGIGSVDGGRGAEAAVAVALPPCAHVQKAVWPQHVRSFECDGALRRDDQGKRRLRTQVDHLAHRPLAGVRRAQC